jgi:hypothetical protein
MKREDFVKACDEKQELIAHKILEKLNETTNRNNTLLTDSMHNNDNNSDSIA